MQQQHTHNGLRRDSFSPPPASDTSFSSVVVDIDAIELEKENIQPLRQGRSALTLARLFTTQHDDRAQQQAVMHGRFQAELAHIDDLDDPMDVYSRYVKWMIENYPQSAGQGNDSQLSPVLERALTDFKGDERYRNDPRFVKLLIIYSEKISNTIELFNYMEANGIGSEIAMYYEEFADFLESREEFDRARKVFVTGINRRARPLGRLKKQYEDFERRAQVYKDELELEAASPPPTETAPPSTRTSSFSDENKPPSPLAPAPAKHIPIITTVLDDAQSHSSHTHLTSNTQQAETHDRGSGGQKFPVTINANGRAERLMIDLTDIYVSDEEFSIEEIRARRYRYSWRHTNNLSVSSNSKQSPSASPPLPAPPPAGSSAKHYRDDPVSEPASDMPPQKKAQPDKEQDPLSTPYRTQAPSLSVKELLPQSPSDEERHFFGSRRRLTASPTMNTKYASEEMNKIFSDRSRTRRSIDSQWSAEDTQDVGRNELDNFTMAYSIPNLPPLSLPPFSRYLDSEIVNEFEDDDDQAVRTEGFVTRLENGYSSTITQDIAALKRRRAEEMALGDNTRYLRSSLGRSSIGSLSSAQRRYGGEGGGQRSIEHTVQDELESPFIFKDGGAGLDVGMTVPMLEDEAPPAFINDLPYT
ncbi:hypothetical protein BGX30_002036 [Mortierella sp. GBA39]|nr:hypothetical protein BGX30_002036 [Mortierella sp. GBA39]